jgi:hypothetical protein
MEIGIVGGGIQLGSLGTAATNRPIVPAPRWLRWWSNWWNDWQGKPKYSEKTCPSEALSTTNLTCCSDANPGRRCGKPATNRLSYGTSFYLSIYLSMALQSFVGPWPLFQFLNPIHSRYDSLDGRSAPRKGRYLHTGQHKHRINAHNTDIHALSGIRTHNPSDRAR